MSLERCLFDLKCAQVILWACLALKIVALTAILTACAHRAPDYSLCGVPYTDAEDQAGIEHACPPVPPS